VSKQSRNPVSDLSSAYALITNAIIDCNITAIKYPAFASELATLVGMLQSQQAAILSLVATLQSM